MKTQHNQKIKNKKTRFPYQGNYFMQGRDFLSIKLLLFSFIFKILKYEYPVVWDSLGGKILRIRENFMGAYFIYYSFKNPRL